MDPTRFDQLSRLFARHRLSRRQVSRDLATGGLAAGLLAAGLDAAAQGTPEPGATPSAAAVEAAKPTTFLFVQSFAAGSLAPQSGKPNAFTLTLRGGHDQTVYFSDRPERIFGLAPTDQFLKGLNFTPANPPNAALVAQQGPGRAELVVLELFNPQYDAANAVLTYEVRVLQDTRQTPLHFNETPVTQLGRGRTYGASALFIDDCNDGHYACRIKGTTSPYNIMTVGCCWSWSSFSCKPCGDLNSTCNSTFPQFCQGNCEAVASSNYNGTSGC
jgi:hypothetical protein